MSAPVNQQWIDADKPWPAIWSALELFRELHRDAMTAANRAHATEEEIGRLRHELALERRANEERQSLAPPDPDSVPQWGGDDWREWARRARRGHL